MLKINRKMVVWGAMLSLLCTLGFQIPAPAGWQKPVQPSMTGGALTCLVSHPLDESKFLVASGQQVFEAGKENTWQPLWSQADAGSPFKRLFSFDVLPDIIFAITNRSVFMGNLKDRSWHVVYKDSGKTPLAFAVHPKNPNRWFLGTQKGLWETQNAGRTWSPSAIFHTSGSVPLLIFNHDRFFLADEKTLYLAMFGGSARSVLELSKTTAEVPATDEENPGTLEEPLSFNLKIHDLIVSKRSPQELFLATASGVFQSCDSGHRWEPLSRSGLQSTVVYQLAYSKKKGGLYAATPRGVYVYDARAQKWTGLFEGLAKDRTQGIAVLNEEKLIAITEEGFVQYPLETFVPEAGPVVAVYQPPEETLALFRELLAFEPSAREIHQRVIQYADVANGKIKRWHAESRLAALFPSLSFSKNFSRGATIDIDRGGTNDPDEYIIGPVDSSKGGYRTLSWDFGDMIYSSDQTSIDSREKLMVELRNDLLSEATRIYYERRRLQIDLVFTLPVSGQEHLENLLRMDELTALLDGMTDGFFSKRLEAIYAKYPKLEELWRFKQVDTPRDSGLVPRDSKKVLHQ
ncbi:MAG: hypothetical protein WC530_01240 [Candidatus Omnitrophota bacterium]|jgi:hypothetical protein